MILNINDKIALVVCSNGKNIEDKVRLEKLEGILVEMGLVPVFTKYIYRDKYGRGSSPQVRAEELMSFYKNNEIKAKIGNPPCFKMIFLSLVKPP